MSLDQHQTAALLDQSAFARVAQRCGEALQAGMDGLIARIAAPLDRACEAARNMETGPNLLAGAKDKLMGSIPSFGGTDSDVAVDAPPRTPGTPGQAIEVARSPGLERSSPEMTAAMADFKSCVAHNSSHDCSIDQLGAVEPMHYRNANMKQIGTGVSV